MILKVIKFNELQILSLMMHIILRMVMGMLLSWSPMFKMGYLRDGT